MFTFEWLLVVLLACIWALSFTAIEIGLIEVNPFALVFWRVFPAAIFITAVTLIMGHRFPLRLGFWLRFMLIGFFGNVLPFSLIAIGQQYIQAGLAAILNASTPIFTALLAHFMLTNEPLHLHKGAGLLCGFIGVAVIFGADALFDFNWSNLGQLLVVLASASYGLAFILGKKYGKGINVYVSSSAMLICSSIIMFLIVCFVQPGLPQYAQSWGVWGALLFMSLGGTALAYIIYYYLLARIDTTNVALVTFIIPPIAVLSGWLFLQESLNLNAYIGMLLILGSLVLLDKRAKKFV